jgi:hypothetical protein
MPTIAMLVGSCVVCSTSLMVSLSNHAAPTSDPAKFSRVVPMVNAPLTIGVLI